MKRVCCVVCGLLACAAGAAAAADQPGLEVFGEPAPVVQPYTGFGPAEPTVPNPNPPPVVVPQGGFDPFDDGGDQVYIPPAADTFATSPVQQQTYAPEADPYQDPNQYAAQPTAGQDSAQPQQPEQQWTVQTQTYETYDEQVANTLADFNTRNREYPGLDAAVQAGSLDQAASIVLQTLRNRRVIATAMEHGPGSSFANGTDSYALERLRTLVRPADQGPRPGTAAERIDFILDSFSSPIVADYSYAEMMPDLLVALHSDIADVRTALEVQSTTQEQLENQRVFLRSASACDFFLYPDAELSFDIEDIYAHPQEYFYPDGSSRAGDSAGITSTFFQPLLEMDATAAGNSAWNRVRNSLRGGWRRMEQPIRYALDIAMPDGTMPRFGPRSAHELTPAETRALDAVFPPYEGEFGTRRIGLAASQSYPARSNERVYGGVYVTRSGRETDARYMAVRFGPLGTLSGVPLHRDFGSISLMSRNIRYIIDAGGYGGDEGASGAHNVLSLNGQFVADDGYPEPGQPCTALWSTNASMDWAADGASFADGKMWQRGIAYIKPLPGEENTDYWLLLDQVLLNNDPQPCAQRIQFRLTPGINAYNDGQGILATPNYIDSSSLVFYAIDAGTRMEVDSNNIITMDRTVAGDTATATLIWPSAGMGHKPARIERDSDLISGHTSAVIVDHGRGRVDVIAWAPPEGELVCPTLNLQLAADLAVFRLRNGKIVRMNFINLQRFQAKEPEGGIWSMRVNGWPASLTIEPQSGNSGWQIYADPANRGSASLFDISFGPGITGRKVSVRPGEFVSVYR